MTQPPEGAWKSAQALLQQLRLVDSAGMLTPLGKQSAQLPLEPRLATMLIQAASFEAVPLACALAALMEGRERINGTLRDALAQRVNQPAAYPQWRHEVKRLSSLMRSPVARHSSLEQLGALLCLAYPDRIAQLMTPGRFKLANGKTATLPAHHPLAQEPFLVAVSVESANSEAGIYLAEPITLATLTNFYPETQQWEERIVWSEEQGKLVGEAVQRHSELVLATRPLRRLPADAVEKALMAALKQRPNMLFNAQVVQLQGRMALLFGAYPEQWNDWSDSALLGSLETWLAPYMAGLTRLTQLQKLPFQTYLMNTLDWKQQTQLERLVPSLIEAPSGNAVKVDYTPCREGRPPVLALKLQEAFGWQATPTVVDGRVPVTLHLLSPARRPLQVTQDLRSFWLNGYSEVRKEMRGRYPKHPWPEDPLTAQATAYTKRRQR